MSIIGQELLRMLLILRRTVRKLNRLPVYKCSHIARQQLPDIADLMLLYESLVNIIHITTSVPASLYEYRLLRLDLKRLSSIEPRYATSARIHHILLLPAYPNNIFQT